MDETILNTDECVEIVTKLLKTEFKLINFTIKPISDSVHGYMGQHLRVKCEVTVNGKNRLVSFFIKKKIENSANSIIEEHLDLFNIESTVLKFLNDNNENATWMPRLLKFKAPNIIILEDLAERNYEMAKVEFGEFDFEHCKCILKALAQLHAFSINYDRVNQTAASIELGIVDDKFNDCNDPTGSTWIKASVDATIYTINETPLPQQCPKEEIIQKLRDYIPKYSEGMQPNKSKYQTISHGDLWANNLMFKYEDDSPVDCCLVDFQVIRYIPFTQDILFSIYVNTNKDFRRKHMEELLEYYYEMFCQLLSSKYGLDPDEVIRKEEYYELVEERRLSALLFSNWYKSFLCMDRSVFTELMQGENFNDLIFGNRVQFIKAQFGINEKYKKLIFEELQDLIDALVELKL